MKRLITWLSHRNVLIYFIKLFTDSLTIFCAYFLAFILRLDGDISGECAQTISSTYPYLVLLTLGVFLIFKIPFLRWSYSSTRDLFRLMVALFVLAVVFFIPVFLVFKIPMPRSIPAIFFIISILFIGWLRLSYRILITTWLRKKTAMHRILVVGAGNAGEMIIRQIRNEPSLGYKPVGIVDDDISLEKRIIHGVPILGSIDRIPELVGRKKIQEIIIATPSASATEMRKIVQYCELSGVEFKTLPGPKEIINGSVHMNQIREVRIEDLLDRLPVQFDEKSISTFIKNKVVLVTGAGGSIGSELSRQILKLIPKKLICLDRAENSLFHLTNELTALADKDSKEIYLADILNVDRCDKIFKRERPDIVFHAAAYKHVPLMEIHPEEAINNNIFGTMNMVNLSEKYGVQKFVLISTDKAVKPVSVMGVSKRIAEKLIRSYPTTTGMNLMVVRFGNVLDSNGSVIPLFKEQIKRKVPITITHSEMMRFFMTIPEAVKLILEAAKMGDGNHIYVLDMGEPLKLVEVARHLIKLSGFEPDKDIPIEYIGIRPGEKLFEELWNEQEIPEKTPHPKIMMVKGTPYKIWDEFRVDLEELRCCCRDMNREKIYAKFEELIPDYTPYR